MAPKLADAVAMRDAARVAGTAAVLGYNYIQNPMVRQIGRLISEGAVGKVTHVRLEMDEDFMADPDALFYWKSEASSGYGALDDFAVHPLSLVWTLLGRVQSVMADMAKPFSDRPTESGNRRSVETHDIANVLFRLEDGASGVLMVNRSAWGRKGRIAVQVFGSQGSIVYDQERMNEIHLYRSGGPSAEAGYATILAGPAHQPYGRFVPAPGHGLGFNDLKVVECRELIRRIDGDGQARVIRFDEGLEIERTVHAMARSHDEGGWVDVR
ncbi:hypothetical protein COL154_014262 [Colletotrichum chrysophilum]|nr:hypothetical protein COL154_014262 [Colletotrichum chrysophilum]